MQWFQALMPSYPEIQRRAQDELDRVVGRDRLPDAQDEKNLPYCRAIIKEVERCYNPFWLGTPHVVSEDFVYNGQLIPKDTVLVLNTWTIHHDERRFPEPQKFNVSRNVVLYIANPNPAIPPYAHVPDSPITTSTTRFRLRRAPTWATPAGATTGCLALGGASARPSWLPSARSSWPSRASCGLSPWKLRPDTLLT